MEKMSKREFWIRLAFYVILGAVIPFAFLVWRFNLFSEVSKVSIGGWGLIAIIVIAIFFISMIKAIKKGLPFSYGVQALTVICKISIPILVCFMCFFTLQDVMKQTCQFLGVLLISETAAGFVNPLPQWAHENQIKMEENRFKSFASSLGLIKKDEEVKK